MSYCSTSCITCVIVAFVTYTQGLLFSMGTNPDIISCGQLYCWIDGDTTDSNISNIIGLDIYYVTRVNISVKVASLSIFDSNLDLPKTEITVLNGTGRISRYQAELTLSLRDTSFCRNVSFLCELNYMNTRNHASVIRKTVSPRTSKNCHEIEKELIQYDNEISELRHEIVVLKLELSRLQEIVDSIPDIHEATCLRGMTHHSSREKFLLWDKLPALCDTETDGGGWVIIQRRTNGDVDFYRGWNDYKNGFGNPDTDFWIGNDVIHNLTSQGYTELRVDLKHQGKQYFAHYSHFDVTSETSLYRLSVSGYNGTAGQDMSYYNNGNKFTTFDKDNDGWGTNCASYFQGAWWYSGCGYTNLNGMWGLGSYTGVMWYGVTGYSSVSFSEIKVRHQ